MASLSLSTDAAPPPRRGARSYLVASSVSQIAALLRYVCLARLLGPEQLGIAATLILTASFFDLISDTAADRFLIQDVDGELASLQKMVQLVLAGRGVGIAIAMALFAWPLAYFYKAPVLAPALIVLGFSPLIAGFIHLDMRRAQRGNDFRAESVSAMVSETAGLAATLIAAYLTRSFTAVLYGLIVRSLVLVLCSHLFSERRYGFGYSREHGQRLAKFSAPLMLSGLVLFLGNQGDRVLIGRTIGFAGLGQYSAILLSIYYPSTTLYKYIHTLYIPLIANARNEPGRAAQINSTLSSMTLLLALCMSAGFALVAPPMVPILYGHAFAQNALIIASVGVLQSTRFLNLWPTTIALATGRSVVILANNMLRLIAWPAALVCVAVTKDVFAIVLGFVFGEFVAFVLALLLLNRIQKSRLFQGFDRLGIFVMASTVIIGWTYLAEHPSLWAIGGLLAFTAAFAVLLLRSEGAAMAVALAYVQRVVLRRP